MFAAMLQALVAPAQALGAPSLPARLLNAVVPDRVQGRRAWADQDRAAIEVRGLNRPGSSARATRIVVALESQPGVAWARVNAPLGRVIVAFAAEPLGLAGLVSVIDEAESGWDEGPPGIGVGVLGPPDGVAIEQAALTLVADVAALALATGTKVAALRPVPVELASVITAVDTMPRLRRVVEAALGQPAADTAIAVANAAAQGLAQGVLGLGLDAAYRVLALRAATANAAAWQARLPQFLATPEAAGAGPVIVERPSALSPGPIERWADSAAIAAATGFAVGLPATGSVRRAAALSLAALPKSARLGREGFATQLCRTLATRGAVVLDPGGLRRLDRIATVVLDADVLLTGRHLLGTVTPLPGTDVAEAATSVHAMFDPADPTRLVSDGQWRLGPIDQLDIAGRRGARQRRALESLAPSVVLGLSRAQRLIAVAAVVPEPSPSLEALAAACRRSGCRLVVAGREGAIGTSFADGVLPGGNRLLASVRALQADGDGVLLVSRRGAALGNADVGVGLSASTGAAPWGAHILIGDDLRLAALLIDGCGVAASVSRRSVTLAQAATALGAVATTTGQVRAAAPRSLLAVNTAAALALAQGVWAVLELGRRPLSPPISRVPWHAIPAAAVLDQLQVGQEGLSTEEARRRQRRGTPTTLARTSLLGAVAEELANPLTPILAAGAALSAAVGSMVDAGLVAGVSLASALIGGMQRRGTDRALAALLAESAVTARVRRDGSESIVAAEELVPGDIVLLGAGEVIPADCRVIEADNLEVDESSLTGEPFPVTKSPAPVIADTVAERTSMLYEGTTAAAGRGVVVVVATGNATEAGRSMAATRVGAAAGGVEARLSQITRVTLPITLGSAVAVVAAGLLRGRSIAATAGAGVSLAVAAVPEGLPFLVSAAQLAAARRLSSLGALVRNPRTIEALGRVDVLCFDKTGTLTEGRIALGAVLAPHGAPTSLAQLSPTDRAILAAGLRATPRARRGQQLAHLTDRAVAAGGADADVTRENGSPRWRQRAVLPFESSRSFHAALGDGDGGFLLSVKGAPETVLPRCTAYRLRGQDVPIPARERRRLSDRVERLAGQGYRVLAVAERAASAGDCLEDSDVGELSLLGFLALTDPVRSAAGSSIAALRDAGVQIVMITGDHPSTAAAVAGRLDLLNGGRVLTGTELDALDDEALDAVLASVAVVARGTPAHKVRVVQGFQRLQRTVAMTGDGANDAPAIRLADVGLALGRRGTPAARAAADLVVTDDRLETIIAALIEGRAMWGSVRQALGILVGGNLGEIAFTVLGAALTGVSPLTARQLLLVNLLTDLAPALAVALRPPHAESAAALLAEGPEASLGHALTRDVATRAAATALGATAAWLLATAAGYGAAAQTVALAALVGTQLGQTLAVGGLSRGVLTSSIGSAAALVVLLQTPAISTFFGSTPLGLAGWGIALAASIAATGLSTRGPQLLTWLSRPVAAGSGEHPRRDSATVAPVAASAA
jgi:cation-transporting ATPase I